MQITILNKTTENLVGIAQDVLNELKALLPDSLSNNIEFKYRSTTNDYLKEHSQRIYVTIQFEDGTDFPNIEIPDYVKYEKVRTSMEMRNKECTKAHLFNNEREKIFEIVKKYKLGFFAINKYSKGTHFEFIMQEGGYNLFDEIEVVCPDINDEKMIVGKDYFVGTTRPHYRKKGFVNFQKRKLLNIEYNPKSFEYNFTFEGMEDDIISTYTRGHVCERQRVVRRLDYTVISRFFGSFMSNMTSKIGKDLNINLSDIEHSDNLKLIKLNEDLISAYKENTKHIIIKED